VLGRPALWANVTSACKRRSNDCLSDHLQISSKKTILPVTHRLTHHISGNDACVQQTLHLKVLLQWACMGSSREKLWRRCHSDKRSFVRACIPACCFRVTYQTVPAPLSPRPRRPLLRDLRIIKQHRWCCLPHTQVITCSYACRHVLSQLASASPASFYCQRPDMFLHTTFHASVVAARHASVVAARRR